MENEIYLFVGLGNPEDKYTLTRHNTGFRAIDFFAKTNGFEINKNNFNALYTKVNYKGKTIILAKPLTYMNNSGEAVYAIKQFFKIDIKNIVIIYDDMDLDVGKIRLREKGSSGGHNGIKSIISILGTDEFKRIRIGIGKPEFDTIDFVLGKFNEEDEKKIQMSFANSQKALDCFLDSSFSRTMSLYNK